MALPAVTGGVGSAIASDHMEHSGRLAVSTVKSLDSKTFDIAFSTSLSGTIREFVDGNGVYLTRYIRVSGGSAGEPDAALDGTALDDVAGARVFTVDGNDRALRVVLGPAVTMDDSTYEVWLDGAGHHLSNELLITGRNGAAFAATSTRPVRLRGTTAAPRKASIARADATDARTLRVAFAGTVLAGMPASRYAATGIEAVRADGTSLRPVYVQRAAGTDSTVWELSFGADLGQGRHRVSIAGRTHALETSAGRLGAEDVVSAEFDGTTAPRTPPRVVDVTVDGSGDRIVVAFDRKIATVNTVALPETQTGVGGGTLTRAELLSAVEVAGTVATGAAAPLAQNLETVAAYAPDLKTLVIKLEQGTRLKPGSRGSVTFRDGSLADTAGLPMRASVQRFTVPWHTATTAFDANSRDYLHVDRTAHVDLRRNAFELTNPQGDLSVRPENVEHRLVNDSQDAIVVDNKYIRATFVPGFGGRLLSLIYKPTGNDLLYTNPTGTPYGFSNRPPGQPGTSPFYHNWLMVWGGIFPTLTEAEHGKYWFLPFDYSIKQDRDSVAITMSKKDTIDYADKPSRYVYGPTGLEVSVTYTISRTGPGVAMSVSIHNPGAETVRYEYWTCTTLAPGAPSNAGSPTMEIVSPVQQIRRDPAYTWMADVEKPANPGTPEDRFLTLDKLKKMSNWQRDGIAYGQGLSANPQGDWWGVINQENGEGVVRVGDNDVTPGMKFWEWGYNASFDTNVYANGRSARPYIELWAGTSNRFFEPATIAPGATTSWTETYLPTMDLANVTNASANGSAELRFERDSQGLRVRGDVFSSRIGDRLTVRLVDTADGRTLASRSFRAAADQSADLTAAVDDGATVRLVLTDREGKVLLQAEKSAG